MRLVATIVAALIFLALPSPPLGQPWTLHVKADHINPGGTVNFHLPLLSAVDLEVEPMGDAPVELAKFYEAYIETGVIGTTQRNVLVVRGRDDTVSRYRITGITIR